MSTGRLRCASILAAVCAVATLAQWSSAQQPPAQPAFRFERPIVADGAGPRRLAIDVPLLVGSAPFRAIIRSRNPQTGAVTVRLSVTVPDAPAV